ncbi:MAG: transglutaminase family protein [Anaerolineales bacterium]|jgi:transglutaminase-like putative cysteine protease
MNANDRQRFLQSTPTIDHGHPLVVDFAQRHIAGTESEADRAVRLYYAVRDGVRYDPYRIDLSVDGLKASTTLVNGYGWCVSKAILLAACLRGVGIPARLGFADVRNHLSTARMRELMQTDLFCWHGYTSIFLKGRWVKATPAFNVELCAKFGYQPLEFDGHNDSLYPPFDLEGKRHMEYVRQRGEYDDAPIQAMIETFLETYPIARRLQQDIDFERDVDLET